MLQVSNPNVCQLRLDFIKFLLSGPSLQRSPFGHCLDDRMAIFSSQQPSYGLSEGNLICGDMTGQHSKTIAQYLCFLSTDTLDYHRIQCTQNFLIEPTKQSKK